MFMLDKDHVNTRVHFLLLCIYIRESIEYEVLYIINPRW